MQGFWADWLVLVTVFLLALLSPGPDFIVAVRHSVLYSRRVGIVTALGFALGVGVHVTYCLAGLALVIAKSVLLFGVMKYAGAAYLFYIGVQALRSQGLKESALATSENKAGISSWTALRTGFITNLFNPKATLFFIALFTQIMKPDAAIGIRILYGLTCVAMTFLWFSLVSAFLTTPRIKARFFRFSKWTDRICGAALIALGVRLAITKV